MDRLDTFSAACLAALGAPVTANNVAKLRTWAHFECTQSLAGQGLIACWNPWAIEGSPGGCSNAGCGWSAIAAYPSCAAGVAAAVAAWRRDVPAIIANLQADGPYSAWWQNPILCQLGYWIRGRQCAPAYSGFVGFGPLPATSGAPDPRWLCPGGTAACSPACDACHTCVAGACQPVACPAGTACVNGHCLPPTPPPGAAASLLPLALLLAGGGGAWWYARRRDAQGGPGALRRPRHGFDATGRSSGGAGRSQRRERRLPRAGGFARTRAALERRALARYGVAPDLRSASFVLRDGTLLAWPEGAAGARTRESSAHHSDVVRALGGDYVDRFLDDSGWLRVQNFRSLLVVQVSLDWEVSSSQAAVLRDEAPAAAFDELVLEEPHCKVSPVTATGITRCVRERNLAARARLERLEAMFRSHPAVVGVEVGNHLHTALSRWSPETVPA